MATQGVTDQPTTIELESRRDGHGPAALPPLERLEVLCDPGSIHVIRSVVRSARLGGKAQEGDGVVGASATIAGRPVFCFAEDGRCASFEEWPFWPEQPDHVPGREPPG